MADVKRNLHERSTFSALTPMPSLVLPAYRSIPDCGCSLLCYVVVTAVCFSSFLFSCLGIGACFGLSECFASFTVGTGHARLPRLRTLGIEHPVPCWAAPWASSSVYPRARTPAAG